MLNWDDLKFFLAICKAGSVRGAAELLQVNHATVSRRINAFELALGQRLFERTNKGYQRTALGDEIYSEASYLEERLSSVERKVVGKDDELSGDIRVTFSDLIGVDVLMPGLVEFTKLHPKVELDIADSHKLLNLANREADVAFRVIEEPPEYLIGRKLAVIHRACYTAKSNEAFIEDPEWLAAQNWMAWSDKQKRPIGKIAKEYPKLEPKHKIANSILRTAACKRGLGVAILPCFAGDIEPELIRVPPYTTEGKYSLWILSHPDLRKNKKIQTFVRFMTDYMATQKDLIEGRAYKQGSA